MALRDRLAAIASRYEELTAQMGEPDVATDHSRVQVLAKERSQLEEIVSLHHEFQQVDVSLSEARSIVADGGDAELMELAKEEIGTLESDFMLKLEKSGAIGSIIEGLFSKNLGFTIKGELVCKYLFISKKIDFEEKFNFDTSKLF